ncbi:MULTISPECIES: class I SAM-dependent methyltransferase [Streptococcus]|mgnify:FL=1|uniref:class I SAM-dependent DNA methyltransferase n=1 Tax=Streptococcus TaxID=1301 RepID=UPI0018F504DF|nr:MULTISPECIES: methyltransferase domain-containing protein [Streptococcus]MBJ7540895.1 class I SAM-dependent methyltransferase [Streptococcus vicugnae]
MKKAKMFDGYANAYDQWFMSNANVFASELKLLHRALHGIEKDNILSIGCGSGLFEAALNREYGIKVQRGVEPSNDMAEIARKRGMTVKIGDAETSQLTPNAYDVIYLNGCSSYIKNLSAAYQNCHKALKKGGHLILLDVPVESAYGILYKFAAHVGEYDKEIFKEIAPTFPYPIELVRSAIFHSPLEKENILRDELGMTNIRYFQTLTAQPIYTNDFVEEPIEGYDKGGYVALVAQK